MSRASVRVVNETKWNTDHLRAFVMAARAQVFGEHARGKRLVVTFVHSRGAWITGYAYVNGTNSRVRIPRENVDKEDLAQTIVHELAHNAGAKGERWMRRSKQFGFRHPDWRQNVAWAAALPLEHAAPTQKPSKIEKLDKALAIAQRRWKQWTTRTKRAQTALRKWTRRIQSIERRMAAHGKEGTR